MIHLPDKEVKNPLLNIYMYPATEEFWGNVNTQFSKYIIMPVHCIERFI